ncbi:MAG: universal stress protein [Actinomycetota bacterium]|nr:universal stress protein [Actinomycetota bacterium]
MLRSVMVPTDFSPEFGLLLRYAEGLAALGVRRVVLGHAVEASGMEGPVIAATMDKVREQIRAMSSDLASAGLDVEVRVVTGPVSECLMGIAAETHVDAVVCGTHGKGLLTKLIAGSVSEDMVTNASVPTIAVRYDLMRGREHPAELARAFAKQIIVPIDFSSSSMRAFDALLSMPKDAVGTAFLTHVIDAAVVGDRIRRTEDGAEFQLRNMAAIAAEKGITARPVVRQGDPRRAVLQEAKERRATGMIVGTQGPNPLLEAVLGSVSLTLMRQASCPVMIVP